jgi:hypothetical protein
VYRLTWRLPLAGLVAFSHLQFSQIRGRQPYSIVRKIPYLIFALIDPHGDFVTRVAARIPTSQRQFLFRAFTHWRAKRIDNPLIV